MNSMLAMHVIVLVCMGGSALPTPPERSGPRVCTVVDDVASHAIAERTKDAMDFLAAHRFMPVGRAPLIAVGALNGEGASGRAAAVIDAAAHGLGARWAGHPALLLEPPGPGTTGEDPEAILHELVHVSLRTRGALEPGWTTRVSPHEPGVAIAIHESAMIEEALADFITASKSRSPILYRASARPGTPPRSVRGFGAQCPKSLSGHPHEDASILTGALWDVVTKHGVEAYDILLAAIAKVAPSNTHQVRAFAEALAKDLQQRSPTVAKVWADAIRTHGLKRCWEPIPITPQRSVQGPLASPIIPARHGEALVASVQRYEVDVYAFKSISVGVRFGGQQHPPHLHGMFINAQGRAITTVSSPLNVQTNALASTVLVVPPKATRFLFRWTNPSFTPIVFDDVKVIPLR